MSKIKFETGNYYHIFNRGVDKRDIFGDEKDFVRFIKSMRIFNFETPAGSIYDFERFKTSDVSRRHRTSSLVDFVAYCLNKNHYHFLVFQKIDGGISKFMKRLGDGYTKFFNYKYNRSGALFQGKFKAIHLNSEGKILRASAYINGNPEIHKIAKAENWILSSYKDYLGIRNGTLCKKETILKDFSALAEYKNLVDYIIKDSQELKEEIKEFMLE